MSTYRKIQPRVDAAPFRDWIETHCRLQGAEAVVELIGFADVDELPAQGRRAAIEAGKRRLFRYRHGRLETKRNNAYVTLDATTFPRSVVEDALHHVRPGLFFELYPELADEDIMLEPDAWCPFCEQMVTPVDGLCPWCLCDHGHLFREVGVTEDGFACLACLAEEQRSHRRKAA